MRGFGDPRRLAGNDSPRMSSRGYVRNYGTLWSSVRQAYQSQILHVIPQSLGYSHCEAALLTSISTIPVRKSNVGCDVAKTAAPVKESHAV